MTGVWIGVAVVGGVALGASAVVVAIVVGVLLWYLRQWPARLALVIVALSGVGPFTDWVVGAESRQMPDDAISAVRGKVASVEAKRSTSQSFVVDVEEARIDDEWEEFSFRLWVTGDVEPAVGRNDRVFVSGTFEPLEEVEPGFRGYLDTGRIDGSGYARKVEIDIEGTGWWRSIDDLAGTIRDRLQAAVPGDRGVLLSGFVTGDDARLSAERQERFVATGTTHLTAVSGANIALLLFIVAAAGRRLGLLHWSPWLIALAVIIWAYAILVGMETPVMRAAIVATFAVFAARLGRRPDFVTLIVLTAAIQALAGPGDVQRVAYRLSIASSIALVLALAGDRPAGVFGWVRSAVLSVCAAQVATVVVLVPTFERISWTTIPANLIVAPVASLAFVLGLIASVAFVFSETLGTAIAGVAGVGCRLVIAVVDIFGRSAGATMPTGDVGWVGRAAMAAITVGGVAMMSVETRRAVRRWWGVAIAHEGAVAVVLASSVVGVVMGWSAAGLM